MPLISSSRLPPPSASSRRQPYTDRASWIKELKDKSEADTSPPRAPDFLCQVSGACESEKCFVILGRGKLFPPLPFPFVHLLPQRSQKLTLFATLKWSYARPTKYVCPHGRHDGCLDASSLNTWGWGRDQSRGIALHLLWGICPQSL